MTDQPTDLVLSQPQQRFLPSEHEAGRIGRLAHAVANTEFVPRTLRGKPEAIMAAMLTGREIGIGPMHALRGIDVIDGRPSLSAELMASLVLRAGHHLWIVESTAEVCTLGARRHDWPEYVPTMDLSWSMEDAALAGLVDPLCKPAAGEHAVHEVRRKRQGQWVTEEGCDCKENWRKYPRAMLRARATSELCRAIFPDVVERVGYVAEELGSDEPVDHAGQVEVVREVAPDHADTVDATYADGQDDPDGDGDGEVEDAEVIDPDPEPEVDACDVCGSTDDDHDGRAHAAAEEAQADAEPWSWRAHLGQSGVRLTDLIAQLRTDWPSNDQAAAPARSRDLDRLCDDPAMAEVVRATIEDLAEKAGAA